jgi:hypothetical protein
MLGCGAALGGRQRIALLVWPCVESRVHTVPRAKYWQVLEASVKFDLFGDDVEYGSKI